MKDSRATDEPVAAKDAKQAIRYEMMAQLREGAPPSADEFTTIVADHAKFIESGGGSGSWQIIVTSGGLELGLVLGLYCPPQGFLMLPDRLAALTFWASQDQFSRHDEPIAASKTAVAARAQCQNDCRPVGWWLDRMRKP